MSSIMIHLAIAKKVKEMDLRYRALETKKIALTPEMEQTMFFYRDM